MQPINDTKRRWLAGIVAIAILAIMTTGVIVLKKAEKQASAQAVPITSAAAATTPPTVSLPTQPDPTPTTTAPSTTYKNGTYTASDSYSSPDGIENIAVTVTINNDTVTTASADPQPSGHTSEQYQQLFVDNFKQFVVGQNVDNVFLSRVSGSSLTSRGFNNALEQIKQQAKA